MTLELFANAAQLQRAVDDAAPLQQTAAGTVQLQQAANGTVHPEVAVNIQYTTLAAEGSFAAACNAAAKQSSADWLLFFAPCVAADARLCTAMQAVCEAITATALTLQADCYELRQLPLEAGHHFDPITRATQTIEPEAFAVRRSAFLAAGGLDPAFSLHLGYEFALRMQAAGFTLRYLPAACVTVNDNHDRLAQPTLQDYIAGYAEQLLLAAKHKNVRAIIRAKFAFFAAVRTPKHYPSVRKHLLLAMPKLIIPAFLGYFWRFGSIGRTLARSARAQHNTYPPESIPQRGRVAQYELQATPLVSIVVRTCGRPAVLAETLKSLRHQTYSNFEIVLIEDGAPTAQQMVVTAFSDLPIRYHATQTNVGRGRAGNIGIERAQGEYVCFLDDDDFHYPDYIEASLAYLQSEAGLDFIYTPIMALEMDVACRTPSYDYTIVKTHPILFDHLNLMDMCVKCRVPMSGGMFRRALYDQVGGMREDIDADEDWAMWLRFSMVGKRKNPNGLDILRAESLCMFPADPALAAARHEAYEKFDFTMLSDPALQLNVTAQDLQNWKEQVHRDIAHLAAIGTLKTFLQGREQWPRYTPIMPEDATSITLTALQINGYYQAILDEAACTF